MIDLYCERTGPGFWAEPFNALTNLSFLIAAVFAWGLWRRMERRPGELWILIGLMAAISIGSFLFHTFATLWAQFLDVLPIILFQVAYLWIYTRRVVNLNRALAFGLLVGLALATLLARQFPETLNRSLSYAPGVLIVLSLGVYHLARRKRECWALLAAGGVFLVALFFRTIDEAVCGSFPLGTHFLWHLLNGLTVYLAFRALALNGWTVPSRAETVPPAAG